MNTTSTARPGVLSGVRVLDFTWKTVGPWSTRLLTHYGAEVIHVERAGGWDDHRYNAAPSIVTDEPKVAQTLGMTKVYSDPQFNTHRDESAAATERPKLYAAPYFNTLHNGKLAIRSQHQKSGRIEDRRASHRHVRCAGGKLQCRGVAELGPYLGATPRHKSSTRLPEYVGFWAHGRLEDLPQLRADGRRTIRSVAGLGLTRQAAGWLGILVSRRHGRLDGRAFADPGSAASEED